MFRSTAKLFFAACFVPMSIVGVAQAQTRGVVELFTSQACSSCPAADRLLAELERDPSLIVLSWHIDYWDYLGWKDTFSKPAFTARQRAYSAVRGDRNIYTPQVIVNGVRQTVGSDRSEIDAAISSRRGSELTVPITFDNAGSAVRVSIGAASIGGPRTGTVYLLPVFRSREVAIRRGENASRTVTYTNVVRSVSELTSWAGEAISAEVPSEKMGDADGYLVLLQSGSSASPGPVLGAAKGPNETVAGTRIESTPGEHR
ncbi:MAG: DUF1223 domain-containing protein [Pseudomonadota bacterium]